MTSSRLRLRLHERRRLRSSAKPAAASRLAGIACEKGEHREALPNVDVLRLLEEADVPAGVSAPPRPGAAAGDSEIRHS